MADQAPRSYLAPIPNAETQRFWDAASEGKLLIKRCNACTKPHYYPRALCPFCFSSDTVWEESTGNATIYSVSVFRRGAGAPYALAYVTLAEGVAVLTNIIDCDFDALAIGQAVQVRHSLTDGGPPVPTFAPVLIGPVLSSP